MLLEIHVNSWFEQGVEKFVSITVTGSHESASRLDSSFEDAIKRHLNTAITNVIATIRSELWSVLLIVAADAGYENFQSMLLEKFQPEGWFFGREYNTGAPFWSKKIEIQL